VIAVVYYIITTRIDREPRKQVLCTRQQLSYPAMFDLYISSMQNPVTHFETWLEAWQFVCYWLRVDDRLALPTDMIEIFGCPPFRRDISDLDDEIKNYRLPEDDTEVFTLGEAATVIARNWYAKKIKKGTINKRKDAI
jgi:hypothetical protein